MQSALDALCGTSEQCVRPKVCIQDAFDAAAVLAAGAIFGLGGALAVYCARHRDLMGSQSDAILRSLGQSLALNIAIGFSTPQIDQWWAAAHASARTALPHALLP